MPKRVRTSMRCVSVHCRYVVAQDYANMVKLPTAIYSSWGFERAAADTRC